MKTPNGDTVTLMVAMLALGLVGLMAFGPNGSVRDAVATWNEERAVRRMLIAEWPRIAQGARVDSTAPDIVIVEFADYQCPYCIRSHAVLRELVAKRPDIGVAYRHLPLPNHPQAEAAARAEIGRASCGKECRSRWSPYH